MRPKIFSLIGTVLFFGTATAQVLRAHSSELLPRKGGMRPESGARFGRKVVSGERFTDNGEFLIDTSITPLSAPGRQGCPAVAFDGIDYLVVWEDKRSGSYDIYGARVTPGGVVLDPQGIPISTATNEQRHPAVSFDGTNYLVVWKDYRGYGDIYGARVTPGGVVLDPTFTITTIGHYPAVCFDGTNYLVVWQEWRPGGFHIYGVRVTQGGVILDSLGIPISTAIDDQISPTVGFDGTNYLVVWQDERNYYWDIYGARVTPEGVVLDTAGIAISTAPDNQWYPVVSFDGTNYLVVWQDEQNSSYPDIYGARVTPEGVVLDTAGIAISTAGNWQKYPAVGFDSTNYLVVWEDWRSGKPDIYGAQVTPEGVVLDSTGFPISTGGDTSWCPAVCFDGTNYLVAWEDYRGDGDIYGARVTPEGVVLDTAGIAISIVVNWQHSPAVSFDGTNYLVAWEDYRNNPDTSNIYGARVTSDGVVLDSSGIPISTAVDNQSFPAVSFDGTNYLVVWQDGRNYYWDIYGARVTPEGVVLDPTGFAISTAVHLQKYPVVGFDGTNYLVVWQDYRNTGVSDIYGARVTSEGVVLDPTGFAISTAAGYQGYPAIGFDGINYLVVWTDWWSGKYDIYGARVTPGGVVLDPLGIPISTAGNDQVSPVVCFDGTNFLVVWEDSRSGNSDIYGCRVTQEGVVLDSLGIPISTAVNSQQFPAVAFDGTNFLVVWEYQQSGGYDLYGARVSPQGVVFDSRPVVTQEGNQVYPTLAQGQGNQLFLVYQGWAGTVGGKNYNTDRIWGKMNPAPGVEERPALYASRLTPNATIVRGVLRWETDDRGWKMASGLRSSVFLLDVAGRKVLELVPGANDVRHLPPGVYFICQASGVKRPASSIQKVIITE